jgi:hypothetical protein
MKETKNPKKTVDPCAHIWIVQLAARTTSDEKRLMQRQNQKGRSPGLDTVLEGPDQLDQVLSVHLTQDYRAFPCCASRIYFNITSFPVLRLKMSP